MIRKSLLLVACFVWLLALVGCGGGASDPMVGTWSLKLNEDMKKMMPKDAKEPTVTAEFKGDKTFEVKMNMDGKEQVVSGTYELKEKELTMKATMEDGKPSNDKPEVVTLSEDKKSFPLPGAGAMMGSMHKN